MAIFNSSKGGGQVTWASFNCTCNLSYTAWHNAENFCQVVLWIILKFARKYLTPFKV